MRSGKTLEEKETSLDAIEWSKRVADSGAGEILLDDQSTREETGDGFDLELN